MTLAKKIAAAAGALTLAATGIAAAGSPPEAADTGLTNAEERTGKELPVAGANAPDHVEGPEAPGDDVDGDDPVVDEVVGVEGEGGNGPVDNHGAVVSAVAQTEHSSGREHGAAVSAVAREGHGPAAAETGGDDDASAAGSSATEGSGRPAAAGNGRK